MRKVKKYTLPDSWACYLVNGDDRGTRPEDISAIEKWLKIECPGACVSVEDDSAFYWNHEASNVMPLGENCSTFIFYKEF